MLRWYPHQARDLPWRRPEATPWQIMVSEFMLQQTPVSRVLRPWRQWVDRWPTPDDLAASSAGEAVRAWGRLGYPRRALRLHQAATFIAEKYGGKVPDDLGTLRSLPGVGAYTAAAICSFAYRQRHVVVDTNVRRLLTRVAVGLAYPAPTPTAAETELAEAFLPRTRERAATWAVASMELGALICTARSPQCTVCPVRNDCAWRQAGYPAWDGPPRRGQGYAGTDRQCRGAILQGLRERDQPMSMADLETLWAMTEQRERAVASLLADGLVVKLAAGPRFDDELLALPT